MTGVSLPGRYVGVAPEEEDEDFDFEETLRSIHVDLKGLNEEAAETSGADCPELRGIGSVSDLTENPSGKDICSQPWSTGTWK